MIFLSIYLFFISTFHSSIIAFAIANQNTTSTTFKADPMTFCEKNVMQYILKVKLEKNKKPSNTDTIQCISARGKKDTITLDKKLSNKKETTFVIQSMTEGDAHLMIVDQKNDQQNILGFYNLHFETRKPSLDVSTSTISTNPSLLPADNATFSTLTVLLVDAEKKPISNAPVMLFSFRGTLDTITPEKSITDTQGQAFFKVSSDTKGKASFVATMGDGFCHEKLIALQNKGELTFL